MAQEKWLVDGEKVIDVENVLKLKIGLIAGQVNVIGHDEPGARIEVHSVTGKELRVVLDGDTLEINYAQFRWDNFMEVLKSFRWRARVDVSVRVPRDVALEFGVVSANALITGLRSDATISTVSGDLVIDSHTGALGLNAVSGEISVRDHSGSIVAHTVSGDVTATGKITSFAADSVSGDVFLDLAGIPDQVKVNSVSGSVAARLESGVPAQYSINTVSGRIQLDESEIRGVRGSYSGSVGVLDKLWLAFSANTVSGSISVVHAVSV